MNKILAICTSPDKGGLELYFVNMVNYYHKKNAVISVCRNNGEINKIITSCLPVPPTQPDGPITATFYTSPYPEIITQTSTLPYHMRPLSNGLSTQQGTPHPKWWKNKTGQVVLANEPIGSGLTSGAGNVIFTGNSTSNSLLYFLLLFCCLHMGSVE